MKRVFLTLVVLSFSINSVEAQLYRYKENGKLIVEFGDVTGLLNRSQKGPIHKKHTIKTVNDNGWVLLGNLFVRLENGGMISKHGTNLNGSEITWEKGVGPTQLGWQDQGYYPTTIKIYSGNPTNPRTLIIEKTASGFDSYLDINGVRKIAWPSYVSDQFKSAAKELTRINQLYERHMQEYTAVIRLDQALRNSDIPLSSERSFAQIAAEVNYFKSTKHLNDIFSMLIQEENQSFDGNDRKSLDHIVNLKTSRLHRKLLHIHIREVFYGN
tara:strand:- start:275 stop:1084 length:810 start_codon:yes stop_codon:yes gene_type:complete